jgi:acetyl-CoA carboxylase carboxyltransferase component
MPDEQVLDLGLAGLQRDAEDRLDENARKTIRARLQQLATALTTATDDAAAEINAYMAEARMVSQRDDGEGMVAWCDETRQRFWALTGQA